MKYKDYYNILGVKRNASESDLKRAYRQLARKYHPDVSKEANAEERFKAVGEAYEVLKDPEKRTAYDQLGANWQSGQNFRPPPGWQQQTSGFSRGGFSGHQGGDFSEFFESLFGGRGPSRGHHNAGHQSQPLSQQAKIKIDLEDTYRGSSRTIELQGMTGNGIGGRSGTVKTVKVRIPKGILPGQKIRLAGQGGSHLGRQAADLFLEVEIAPHPLYRVEGRDVYLNLPITPWEAALGASVTVPTPTGKVQLKVPAGSAAGSKLRLRRRGIPSPKPGDFIAVLEIHLPVADTEQHKKLFRTMAEEMPFNPRQDLGV